MPLPSADPDPREDPHTGLPRSVARRAAGARHGGRKGGWGARAATLRYGPLAVGPVTIAVILAVGFLLPKSQHLGSLMVAPPTATAALAGPRTTAAIAALSCGGALALDAYDGLLDGSIWAVHLLAILLVSAAVITFRTLRERNLSELTEVQIVSETIQRVLLRPLPRRLAGLRLRSAYHASHPHALIGGDLYAVAYCPTGVRLVIGDVKGKGLPAVDDAAALLGAFREAAQRVASLPELMAYLETSMRNHFRESELLDDNAMERFITALVLEIPDGGTRVRMINCGHPAPYLIRRGTAGQVRPGRFSPPLGLGSPRGEDYPVDTFALVDGATLLLYTDGAIEARAPDGRFYDLGARLAGWPGSDPGELLRYVLDGLLAHVGGELRLDDDVALVALQHDPSAAADADGPPEPPPARQPARRWAGP